MQNPHMIDVVKKLDNLREMSPDSLNSQIDNIGNHIAHVRREVADLERMDTAGGGDIARGVGEHQYGVGMAGGAKALAGKLPKSVRQLRYRPTML